jgi:hypothetical protein
MYMGDCLGEISRKWEGRGMDMRDEEDRDMLHICM